jgi:7-carboxy-7-deazaguanine synthase
MIKKTKLGILSVFLTIDGEANCWAPGGWSVFVRTRGCGVGCVWCDTKYSWSFKGGKEFLPYQLLNLVKATSRGAKKVTITGGEPLEQDWPALQLFLKLLLDNDFVVTIETSGTQDTIDFRKGVKVPYLLHSNDLSFVVDYKLVSSNFKGTMALKEHFSRLPEGDVIKFVIDNEADFYEAMGAAEYIHRSGTCKAKMYFSPSHGNMDPRKLFEMMINTNLPAWNVGLNIQGHKYIFPEDMRAEEDFGGVDFSKRTLGREKYLESTREKKDD